jgi:hypothetical protein
MSLAFLGNQSRSWPIEGDIQTAEAGFLHLKGFMTKVFAQFAILLLRVVSELPTSSLLLLAFQMSLNTDA